MDQSDLIAKISAVAAFSYWAELAGFLALMITSAILYVRTQSRPTLLIQTGVLLMTAGMFIPWIPSLVAFSLVGWPVSMYVGMALKTIGSTVAIIGFAWFTFTIDSNKPGRPSNVPLEDETSKL